MPTDLTLQDARHLQLSAQGLLTRPQRRATPQDVPAAIRRMALLQIDTIHVVARSPYLVLFSRLGAHDPAWLDQALARGELFEYWAHEACLIPAEDYRLLRPRMLDPSTMGWKDPREWLAAHTGEIERLLEHIRHAGPVRSADFARADGKGSGWWDWKPEKRHLEALFTLGRVMVRERRNFQRVYDLAERVRPGWDDARDLPDAARVETDILRQTCRALGIVKPDWVADYYRLRRAPGVRALYALADAGELIPVRVEGWQQTAFVHASQAEALAHAREGRLRATHSAALSPFDPLVWDRKRARELFGFDYRLECYTPAARRQYGYFVLPLLVRGRLVGRLDAKAHRSQGRFEIKALYLEPGVRPGPRLGRDLFSALQALAHWHGTPELVFGQLPDTLRRHLPAQRVTAAGSRTGEPGR